MNEDESLERSEFAEGVMKKRVPNFAPRKAQ